MRFIGTLSCAVLLLIAIPAAQERASFAGIWTAAAPNAQRLIIEQDATLLRITDSRNRVLTYRLDGSESRNQTTTVRGETWNHVSRARWVSSALVIITTTTREAGQQWDWMTIYRRDGQGNLLVTTLDAVLDPGPFQAMAMSTVEFKKAS